MAYPPTFSFSKQLDENGQEKNKLQRTKIVLQRLKLEDLLEDPPATKVRKVQSSTKANTEKIKFVPTRMKFTKADFEDTPPCNITKAKQQKGRTKTARKELFCNSRKSSAKTTSTKGSSQTTKRVKPKIFPNLDNTELLMDISEAEADLIKKPHIEFKRPLNCAVTSKPKCTPTTVLSRTASLDPKPSKTKKMPKSPKLPENLPATETKLALSLNSSENSEFLELEEQCRITDDTTKQALNIDILVPPPILPPVETNLKLISSEDNTDLHYKIFKILQKQQEDFDRLKKQFEDYQCKYSENVKQIENLLKMSNKENQNISPEIPRLENLRVSTLRKRFKRSVTFNISPVRNDENAVPLVVKSPLDSAANPFEDIKLQKAANLYNSMRLNYSSILSTPKFEKSCLLQTPKSAKFAGKRRDSISTKLQKQCWLLQDTPLRK